MTRRPINPKVESSCRDQSLDAATAIQKKARVFEGTKFDEAFAIAQAWIDLEQDGRESIFLKRGVLARHGERKA